MLRAVQVIVDEGLARPILVGRPAVLLSRIEKFGLRLRLGEDVEVTNPEYDERFHQYWTTYWELMCRRGITKEMARVEMRRRLTLIGAMMVHLGDADGMVCGTVGAYHDHLRFVDEVIGRRPGDNVYAAMNILLLNERTVVLVDTHVNDEPTAEQIAEFTRMAAQAMRRMNLAPKVALLSRSNFGSGSSASGAKMRRALELVRQMEPDLEIDGEMHGDCALDEALRLRILPSSTLKGEANLLVCPKRGLGQHRLQPAQDGGRRQRGGGAVPAGRERAGAHPDFQLDRAPHHQHDGHDGAGRQSRGNVGLSLAPGTRRRGSGQRVPQGSRPRWFRGYLAIETKRRPVRGPGGVVTGPVPRDAGRPGQP